MNMVSLLVLLNFTFLVSALSDGQHVCWNITIGNYCCSDYEEVGGNCIACKNGYTSYIGSPCTVCKQNRYGYRCLLSCSCSHKQRCDNVYGCISTEEHSFPSDILQVTDSTYRQRGITKRNMIIYVGVIAGCFGLFGVFIIGYANKKNKNRNGVSIISDENIYCNDNVTITYERNMHHRDSIVTITQPNIPCLYENECIFAERRDNSLQEPDRSCNHLPQPYFSPATEENNGDREIYLETYNILDQFSQYQSLAPQQGYEILTRTFDNQ